MKRLIYSSLFFLFSVSTAAGAGPDITNPAQSNFKWRGPDGTELPFAQAEEALEFLRTARIVSTKQLSTGINRPLKVKLEKDGVEANAIFRTVNKSRSWVRLDGKTYREFHDRYINECAAYELSRLLEIDNVPPCVVRSIKHKEGTMQLWVENANTIKNQMKDGLTQLSGRKWSRQHQMMRTFDALIYNIDRNQGNMLLDSTQKLWFIDHTRSFFPASDVQGLENIIWCERNMWERLQVLDKDLLNKHLKPYLDFRQIASLLRRRDKLVDYFQKLILSRGEQVVLFDGITDL